MIHLPKESIAKNIRYIRYLRYISNIFNIRNILNIRNIKNYSILFFNIDNIFELK